MLCRLRPSPRPVALSPFQPNPRFKIFQPKSSKSQSLNLGFSRFAATEFSAVACSFHCQMGPKSRNPSKHQQNPAKKRNISNGGVSSQHASSLQLEDDVPDFPRGSHSICVLMLICFLNIKAGAYYFKTYAMFCLLIDTFCRV